MKNKASLLAVALLITSANAVQSQSHKMNKLAQASSQSRVQAKLSARSGTKSKSHAKARAQQSAVEQIWPLTLPTGATWDEAALTPRDFMYEAYCRCVTPDYTEALSICSTGCGNPDTVCNEDFGCTIAETGCNAAQCTCLPDGLEGNTYTYQECVDQCDAVGMILPDSEAAILLAKGTGCGINGKEMWSQTAGAVELPDTSEDCENDDAIVDSWGDSCSDWYDEKPETCSEYDTDDFVATDLCCSCQWVDASTWADSFNPDDLQNVLRNNFAVFFTKDACSYCLEARNFMNSIGYSSYIIDFDRLDNSGDAVQYMQDYIGNTMVPALFLNGYYIGGFTQLVDSYNSGDLETQYHEWNTRQVECINDDTVGDSYGDTCSAWYTGTNLEFCGDYDTAQFIASEMCCECM